LDGSCTALGQSLLQRGLPSRNQSMLSLAADMVPETESQGRKPHILCIVDDDYAWLLSQWQACARKAVGADEYEQRIHIVNATALKYSEPSMPSAVSLLSITPSYLQLTLPQLLRDGVAQNRDTMHVDVDAFLLQDPDVQFLEKYPEADIVAAADLAGEHYGWYKTEDFLARYNGLDPIGSRGFMLNMGVILFRSNVHVVGMFDELIATRKALGPTWGDQTVFNEVLLQWDCTWTKEDGSLAAEGESIHKDLYTSALIGACVGNKARHTGAQLGPLKLVVLPFSIVTRFSDPAHLGPQTVAMHPGADNKQAGLDLAASLCA